MPVTPSSFTPRQVAAICGRSEYYVRDLIRANLLAADRTKGGHFKVSIAAVEQTLLRRPVEMADLQNADRRLAPLRKYMAKYNAARATVPAVW